MKLDDIPFIIKDINDEMPKIFEKTASVKRSFSQGLPKNFMEYSAHVNNKFLNHHLSDIEELALNFPEYHLPKWMKEYQRKKFLQYDILNHDGFFNITDTFILPIASMSLRNLAFVGLVGSGGVDGPDLQTYTTGGGFSNRAANQLLIYRSPSTDGVIGELYDQIALNSDNTTGNIRQGVYDDDGTDPDNLQATTGSIAMTNDFAFKSLTEFGLATVKTWLCTLKSLASNIHNKSGAPLDARFKSFTFGALPDPAGTGFSTDPQGHQHKIGHT